MEMPDAVPRRSSGRIKRRLGYLSAAPRVSTRPNTESVGPRAHVLGVIKAFEELDWEVKPFIVGDKISPKGITKGADRVGSTGFARTLAADLLRLVLGIVNARRAWRELSGEVDWVYERFATFQSLGRIFKRHGGIPWILETNGPFFYEAKAERNSIVLGRLARWIELRAYRECDVLICVSEALKGIVIREANLRPETVVVVPNGVNTTIFDPERYEAKRVFEGFTLGFMGSLFRWQELGLLLEVLSDLREEGMDISLVVVGDGLMRQAWETQAWRLGISANVAFVGWVPWQEAPRYISGFDAGYSGQNKSQVGEMYHSPLKLYEYMAMAKPVVASAFEDARTAIKDGETGFLFEAGDKTDLRRALARAYQSHSRLPEMGLKAREEVVAHHSWTARVRGLISEVERIRGGL